MPQQNPVLLLHCILELEKQAVDASSDINQQAYD
jgi:hypothetical protein